MNIFHADSWTTLSTMYLDLKTAQITEKGQWR